MKTFTALAILTLVIPGAGCTQARMEAPTHRVVTPHASVQLRVPEDIARDPAARMLFKERLRVQVKHKTHGLARTEHEAVRARLHPQLVRAGFDPDETDYILSSLQPPEPARAAAFAGRLK